MAALHTADTATWDASLPSATVLPDQRAAAVDDLLRDVPIPASVDVDAMRRETTPASRYDLGFEVIGRVTCGWIAQWAAGEGTPAAADAVAALRTAHRWPALLELEPQGGFSGVLWDLADRVVRGDRSVVAGYASALGCPA